MHNLHNSRLPLSDWNTEWLKPAVLGCFRKGEMKVIEDNGKGFDVWLGAIYTHGSDIFIIDPRIPGPLIRSETENPWLIDVALTSCFQ
jgi:hypothetical protein